jgi:hypothetical protein
MQPIIDYILNNKEWIFSGIGIFLLSGMIWFLSRLLFSNSPRTYGESGSHTTVHSERIKRESDIEARDNVGHRFEFLDGVIAYARLRGSYTIEDAKLFFSSFKSNDECRKLFAPLIHARACYLLEKYPFAEAKLHRREVEIKLTEELKEEFARHGIRLDGITIGSLMRHPKQRSSSEHSPNAMR